MLIDFAYLTDSNSNVEGSIMDNIISLFEVCRGHIPVSLLDLPDSAYVDGMERMENAWKARTSSGEPIVLSELSTAWEPLLTYVDTAQLDESLLGNIRMALGFLRKARQHVAAAGQSITFDLPAEHPSPLQSNSCLQETLVSLLSGRTRSATPHGGPPPRTPLSSPPGGPGKRILHDGQPLIHSQLIHTRQLVNVDVCKQHRGRTTCRRLLYSIL